MEKKEYNKKQKTYNRHHIIGKSQKELFNVFDQRNVIKMEEIQHNALHGLFKNLLTPKDQLGYIKELFEPILSKESYSLLSILCHMDDKDFYDEGLVKRHKR